MQVENIGETAGLVWNHLRSHGECSLSALEKGIRAPKTVIYMALGWLAREGKINVKEEKRSVRVALNVNEAS